MEFYFLRNLTALETVLIEMKEFAVTQFFYVSFNSCC